MDIFAQCLRKETLIERFKIKQNDSSKHILQKQMKEKRRRDVKTPFQDDQPFVQVTLSRAQHVKMCAISRHLKTLSEVHKFLEDGHAK